MGSVVFLLFKINHLLKRKSEGMCRGLGSYLRQQPPSLHPRAGLRRRVKRDWEMGKKGRGGRPRVVLRTPGGLPVSGELWHHGEFADSDRTWGSAYSFWSTALQSVWKLAFSQAACWHFSAGDRQTRFLWNLTSNSFPASNSPRSISQGNSRLCKLAQSSLV